MANNLQFSQLQLDALQQLIDEYNTQDPNHSSVSVSSILKQAYDDINLWIQQALSTNPNSIDSATQLFFKNAVNVNQNVPTSSSNLYIRTATEAGLQIPPTGDASGAAIQRTSNRIALTIVQDLVSKRGLPTQVDELIKLDVTGAVTRGGQTWGGWAGALFYMLPKVGPKNETVAQEIFSSAQESAKFVRANFTASNTTLALYGADTEYVQARNQALATASDVFAGAAGTTSGEYVRAVRSYAQLGLSISINNLPILLHIDLNNLGNYLSSDPIILSSDLQRTLANYIPVDELPTALNGLTLGNGGDMLISVSDSVGIQIARAASSALSVYAADLHINSIVIESTDQSTSVAIAGNGSDSLVGRTGSDTLIGGSGSDTLIGGSGNDTFVYTVPAAGTSAADTVQNASIRDSVWVGANQLTGTQSAGTNFLWTDANLTQYEFEPSVDSNIGTLTISQGLLGPSTEDKIVIDNFDLNKAQSQVGYLGIHFQERPQLIAGTGPSSFASGNFNPPGSSVDPLPGDHTFTAYVSATSDQAQIVTLSLAGADASGFAIDTGHGLVNFDSNGTTQLTIAAGEDRVTFGLLNTAPVPQTETIQLTETIQDTNADGSTTAVSDTISVTYEPTPGYVANPPPPANTITGDLTPINFGSAGSTVQHFDGLGNLVTDPNAPDPGFNDTLFGTSGNDLISTGGGTNVVYGEGGNDTLVGGSGNDVMVETNGNNVISGGGGQDLISAGNGDNQIYVNNSVDITDAIGQGIGSPSGLKGSFVSVGSGDNTLVGGSGNDVFVLGGGNDLVILGPGNDIVEGGQLASNVQANWTTQNSTVGTTLEVTFQNASVNSTGGYSSSSPYEGNRDSSGQPVGVGDEIILGGSGNYVIVASNGNNTIDVGSGNSSVFAGAGNDVVFAGTGNSLINGQGGDDYIKAESGNNTITGGAGNNEIYGGSGSDIIFAGWGGADWATHETGDNYVEAGSGDTLIFGSGGNDTLIGGSGNDTIYAGDGSEYVDGGTGNALIYGGNGEDMLIAGSGNTTIEAGSGNETIYGGEGNDLINGGTGSNLIYAGDGGSTDNPTVVNVGSGTSSVYGGAGVDQITAGSGNDSLYAGSGSSTIQGGSGTDVLYGGIGSDTLIAGSGNDTLVAGSGSESMMGGSGTTTYQFNPGFGDVELANAKNTDILQFGAGLSLADLTVTAALGTNNVPALLIEDDNGGTLTVDGGLDGALDNFTFADGTTLNLAQLMAQANAQGNALAADVAGPNGDLLFSADDGDVLAGGSGNDTVYGFGANDTLVAGSGGTVLNAKNANALLIGGPGNDTFVINSADDVIQEQPGQGTNTVLSSVDYTQPENVQALTLTGSAALSATGNDQNGILTANRGNDTLIAGSGIDTLIGGAGNDTFIVNNAADVVVEQTNQGDDSVFSSVSYTRPENAENLTLTGNADLVATGNDQNGTLTANSGNDTLISGSGVDTLYSGAGNETYVVNNSADVIVATGAGNDSVLASVSYVLPEQVHTLTLTGSADLSATGNSDAGVTISANSGNDTLAGGAGGSGTLVGGSGADTFVLGNTGAYSAVNNSPFGAIVRLAPNLDFSDVAAQQAGNDLLLQLQGTANSLRLKDYFSSPQSWTIQDGAGASTTAQTLLDATAQAAANALGLQEQQFLTQQKLALFQQFANAGLTARPDGTYYASSFQNLDQPQTYTYDQNQATLIQTASFRDGSPSQTTSSLLSHSVTFEPAYPYYSAPWGVQDTTTSLQSVTVNANDPVINATGETVSTSYSPVWFKVNWQNTHSVSSTFTSIPTFFSFTNGNGQLETLTSQTITQDTTTQVTGTLAGAP